MHLNATATDTGTPYVSFFLEKKQTIFQCDAVCKARVMTQYRVCAFAKL